LRLYKHVRSNYDKHILRASKQTDGIRHYKIICLIIFLFFILYRLLDNAHSLPFLFDDLKIYVKYNLTKHIFALMNACNSKIDATETLFIRCCDGRIEWTLCLMHQRFIKTILVVENPEIDIFIAWLQISIIVMVLGTWIRTQMYVKAT